MSTKGSGLGAEGSREAWRRATQHRDAETADVGDEVGVVRRPSVGRRHQGQQRRGSSSKRSSDTHATARSSCSAHSARSVDLP